MPLVSVITPAYNSQAYIRRCVDSVFSQTFADWEMIIIDDGSTDDTARIADAYAANDKRIRVYHQENQGWCAATNKAIDLSLGEYIFSLDSDNWLNGIDVFSIVGKTIGTFGYVEVIQTAIQFVAPTGEIANVQPKNRQTRFAEGHHAIDKLAREGLIYLDSHGGKFILKSALFGLSMSGNPSGADSRLCKYLMARVSNIFLSDTISMCCEIRNDSLSRKLKPKYFYTDGLIEELKYLPLYQDLVRMDSERKLQQLSDIYDWYPISILEADTSFQRERVREIGKSLFRFRRLFLNNSLYEGGVLRFCFCCLAPDLARLIF